MTLDYSEEINLSVDFEPEIKPPTQAKSKGRGSDKGLSPHLSNAHSEFSLISLGWGGLISELHHI